MGRHGRKRAITTALTARQLELTAPRQFVFWQNVPSVHMFDLYEALGSRQGVSVKVVCESGLPPDRAALGWNRIENSSVGAYFAVSPDSHKIHELLNELQDAIHIVGGISHHANGMRVAARSLMNGIRWGLLSEVPNRTGLFSRAGYSTLLHTVGRKRCFTLAIGARARNWYTEVSSTGNDIFPFGYFVAARTAAPSADHFPRVPDGVVRFIYMGRLTEEKGTLLLMEALAQLRDLDWTLTFCGTGPARAQLESKVASLGIGAKVTCNGVVPFHKAQQIIEHHDWLILPSIAKDGWGVVVNEALSVGTRVICSSICGASELLQPPRDGILIPPGNLFALKQSLRHAIEDGPISSEMRTRICSAAARFSPHAAAEFLLQIVDYCDGLSPKPSAPWLMPQV